MRNDPKTPQGYGSALGANQQPKTACEIAPPQSGTSHAISSLSIGVSELSDAIEKLTDATKSIRIGRPMNDAKSPEAQSGWGCDVASAVGSEVLRLRHATSEIRRITAELDC